MVRRNDLSVFGSSNWSGEIDGSGNSICISFDMGDKDMNYSSIEHQKPSKPRVRHTKPQSSCTMFSSQGNLQQRQQHLGPPPDELHVVNEVLAE